MALYSSKSDLGGGDLHLDGPIGKHLILQGRLLRDGAQSVDEGRRSGAGGPFSDTSVSLSL